MARLGEQFEFAYDYNQLYLYDAARGRRVEGNEYLDALEAATETGLTVGARSEIVDVLMPRQDNFGAMIDVKLTTDEPAIRDDADHVVEFDFAAPFWPPGFRRLGRIGHRRGHDLARNVPRPTHGTGFRRGCGLALRRRGE